jgi:ABC-type branched-subunit amino acid transport system ATPase component
MLRISGLVAGYGAAPVIPCLDMELSPGEIVAVLGRNGSGKSTLVKAIIGILERVGGSVQLLGRELIGLAPHRIARCGVAYVPQGRGIFPWLTVRENLMTGTRAISGGVRSIDERVFGYFPVLKERLAQRGGTMSGGEQQMLAIGRALCSRPRLMLMDEPSDGVAPQIVGMLAQLIPAIAREMNLAVILVEQNADLALAAANRCAVMERGVIVHLGPPDDLKDPEVLKRHLTI